MPWIVWAGAGAVGALYLRGQVEEAVGGAPSPLGVGGLVVYGLAGLGAWCLWHKVAR